MPKASGHSKGIKTNGLIKTFNIKLDQSILSVKAEKSDAEENVQAFHKCGSAGHVCITDSLGHSTPGNKNPLKLVVDASEGFIPLWQPGVSLRWKFNSASLALFEASEDLKNYIRQLMAAAIYAWDSAAPVKFVEHNGVCDFEIFVSPQDSCSFNGCTLASAFFPGGGQQRVYIYPQMFQQSEKEQVETMIHEFGHIFGLRHFFAQISESEWPSEIFGKHEHFTIMNYGDNSVLTEQDIKDLRLLYSQAWRGELTAINGTPIKLVAPYHYYESR